MNFTKPMIDLVREIRKHVPADVKPAIKLANPEVIDELVELYHDSNQTVFRTLVKELCQLAGAPYTQALETPGVEETETKQASESNHIVKVYRGQTQLVELPAVNEKEKNDEPKRIYRGVVIG